MEDEVAEEFENVAVISFAPIRVQIHLIALKDRVKFRDQAEQSNVVHRDQN